MSFMKIFVTVWAVIVSVAAVWFSWSMGPWLYSVGGWGAAICGSLLIGVAAGCYSGWQIQAIWRA